jgi:hypothetical protein
MNAQRRVLPERVEITQQLRPRFLVRLLFILIAFLVVADVVLQTYHFRVREVPWLLKDLFDLDEEQNIPTWYSSAALLFASWLLRAIAVVKKRSADRDYRFWYGLMAGFLFLSFDETAGLHEALNNITNSDKNQNPFSWALIGAVIVATLVVVYMKFVSRLPAWFRARCLIAGVVYVSGVLGMELVAHNYVKSYDIDTLGYNLISAAEEALEMLGVVAFIHALFLYMGSGELASGAGVSAEPAPELAASPSVAPPSSLPAEPAGPSGS